MENEIKVGEYIRANGGYIGKVIKIREKDRDCDTYYVCDTVMASGFYEHIVKHSPNIIDLIQCGDYVNGIKIISIIQQADTMKRISLCGFDNDYLNIKLNNRDIKTVATKEQFESISYKVKE